MANQAFHICSLGLHQSSQRIWPIRSFTSPHTHTCPARGFSQQGLQQSNLQIWPIRGFTGPAWGFSQSGASPVQSGVSPVQPGALANQPPNQSSLGLWPIWHLISPVWGFTSPVWGFTSPAPGLLHQGHHQFSKGHWPSLGFTTTTSGLSTPARVFFSNQGLHQ